MPPVLTAMRLPGPFTRGRPRAGEERGWGGGYGDCGVGRSGVSRQDPKTGGVAIVSGAGPGQGPCLLDPLPFQPLGTSVGDPVPAGAQRHGDLRATGDAGAMERGCLSPSYIPLGRHWKVLGGAGRFWEVREGAGGPWVLCPEGHWKMLEGSERCTKMLGGPGRCWRC